ncbi:hypothetical protein [Undibacterium luofuense]|uniref:hypothetical protein n=1 Tax=Undibacterium luofuense TaxID=2828733 RepID=UPI0030EE1BAB
MMKVETMLPALPVAVVSGASGQSGTRLFAGLGSSGQAWFGLDVTNTAAGWVALAPFPAEAPQQAACVTIQDRIFVLGGSILDQRSGCMRQSTRIWAYDMLQDVWHCMPFEQHSDFLGAVAFADPQRGLMVAGGYHRGQFDDFCIRMSSLTAEDKERFRSDYMAREIAGFHWNTGLRRFDTRTACLDVIAENPLLATCGSGLIQQSDLAWLISGEVKPGLRRNAVVCLDTANCEVLATEQVSGGKVFGQGDGVASPFAGLLQQTPLFAGGTYFPGAAKNYQAGSLFAHQGLEKRWSDECFVRTGEGWQLAGNLPAGRAHGCSFVLPEGILLTGGDSQDGVPVLENWLLSDMSVN